MFTTSGDGNRWQWANRRSRAGQPSLFPARFRVRTFGQVVCAALAHTSTVSRNINRFVILWRSKERSDAAQTIGSMPGLLSAATVQNSAPLHSVARSRHGSQGLRDGASLLLRPGMTKVGEASANLVRRRQGSIGAFLAARGPICPQADR
ncbi:MAG: hypothetical protein E5Y31_25100 [Mesorhizobium sp.]|nr:MAG: hypothetical protein E5Y31_25100 [Mesorhizobium sp.]